VNWNSALVGALVRIIVGYAVGKLVAFAVGTPDSGEFELPL
jgi:hypothetical protein